MEKIGSLIELKELIFLLEIKQENDKQLLKQEFKTTVESLRPVNLIKNTFSDLTTSPDFKGNLVDAAISIASGYLSKKIMVGSTHNPLKKLFGALLQVGVTSLVSKNTEGIKTTASHLIKKIFNKKTTLS
jgi:hypothetical protein